MISASADCMAEPSSMYRENGIVSNGGISRHTDLVQLNDVGFGTKLTEEGLGGFAVRTP